jgi:hypothetical protein
MFMENAKQLRPIGQLFADTLKTYRLNFKKLSLLMLWGMIGATPAPIIIIIFKTTGQLFTQHGAAVALIPIFFLLLAFVFNIYWSVSAWLGILVLLKNPEKRIITAFNEGRHLFWGSLAVVTVACSFIALWSLLLIVPGVIFLVFFSFAIFSFVYEGYRRSAALARSKELVNGNWWPVFSRLLILLVVVIIFSSSYDPLYHLNSSIWYQLSIQIVYPLLSVFVINLLWVIYLFLTYNDLIAIKPESLLPKEKNDLWLIRLLTVVVVAAALFYVAFLFFALFIFLAAG